ncbi:MAG: hypothetical protein A2X25_14620 [Chloroflexi bacterium GWB2_49_20]|nr:MAG: hypothetical protein A2X25_14620 [Chloroflexi bacterium GWB2_49_20]OGN77253.1 MAG: hypothetical protein A2X26_08625 [Chloroflexi bacterium GWC2_49_37]OGN84750.1 MAG: hypothetical protein A2X27_15480 [Chloroflexi bacterium GWD2_49_16]HBG75087.1 hypothetical protein [Anaerolineae bacterium]HCC78438.1 hypothetical protein [Anaerolineae bacterium]
MATAEEVRRYVLKQIQTARQNGEKSISFSALEIHNGLGLKQRFPLVCSAIDADKFLDFASVILIKRDGPKQSSTVRWVFDLKK